MDSFHFRCPVATHEDPSHVRREAEEGCTVVQSGTVPDNLSWPGDMPSAFPKLPTPQMPRADYETVVLLLAYQCCALAQVTIAQRTMTVIAPIRPECTDRQPQRLRG